MIITRNISSMGVTIYPNSLSPTVVASKRPSTYVGQPSEVPSKLPRSTIKPSNQPMGHLTSVPSGKPSNQLAAPG